MVAIDLGDDAWISAHGAPRTAYQLATLRPDVLFASRAATAQLAVPLEGLSSVPILQLGEDGCSVYGRRLVAPLLLNGAGLGRGEETMTSTPRHPAEDAFAAAFCVAFIEGHAPVEAAARALLVSSPRT